MNLKNASLSRRSRRGFTLVELLVVIGIIGILAAAAYPVITGQIIKAKENVAVQKAHDIGLALFNYASDPANGSYPAGATPDVAFQLLYNGSYVPADGSYFLISGTPGGKVGAAAGAGKIAAFVAANNCWGYTTSAGGAGLTSADPDSLPLVSSIGIAANKDLATDDVNVAAINAAINPFGSDGIAVGYKNMSSVFARNNGSTLKAGVAGVAGAGNIAFTPTASLSFAAGPVYTMHAP